VLRIAEYVEPSEERLARLLVQAGAAEAVSVLPIPTGSATSGTVAASTRSDPPWGAVPLALLRQRFHEHGLPLTVIEDSPPMEAIRTGGPGREEELPELVRLIESMGRIGIPVLCINFMAGSGWARTSTVLRGRGGALVSGYDHAVVSGLGDVPAAPLSHEQMWRNLGWLLERIVPVAERAGVRIALHPDDPPLPEVRGVARILSSLDDLERAVELGDSPNLGITFCQGNIAQMTDDVPAAIRRFAARNCIHYVHFRDVLGTPDRFVETFHDEGPTDMYACMRAYVECGVDAPMRSDHVPTLEGDGNDRPGYSTLGRLWAVGYMLGLREAATAEVGPPGDVAASTRPTSAARAPRS
jgi:mannonate dehydratase